MVAVTLLSLLAAALGSWVNFRLNVTERFEKQMQVYYAAAGGIRYASVLVRLDPTGTYDGMQEEWMQMKDWVLLLQEGIRADVGPGLSDEGRKLNLNSAPVPVLVQFFFSAGVDLDQARTIAESIVDWRDADDKESSNGAEGSYYHSLESSYDCKNGPFENIEELRLVRGVSAGVYRSLEPYVTVYGSGRVNLNTALSVVVEALGFSHEGVVGIDQFRSGEDSVPGNGDDRPFTSMAGLETDLEKFISKESLGHLRKLIAEKRLSVASAAFRCSVEAGDGDPTHLMRAITIIDRKGQVKLWTER